jgi:hypothetical protein
MREGIGRIIFPPMPRRLRKTFCRPFTPRVALQNQIWRDFEKFVSKLSPMDSLPRTFISEERVTTSKASAPEMTVLPLTPHPSTTARVWKKPVDGFIE